MPSKREEVLEYGYVAREQAKVALAGSESADRYPEAHTTEIGNDTREVRPAIVAAEAAGRDSLFPFVRAYTSQLDGDGTFVHSVRGDPHKLVALLRGLRPKRLDLWAHGTLGEIQIGTETLHLRTTLQKLLKPGEITIDEINIESCNVGLEPGAMLPLLKLFSARKITAWNHFHVVGTARITGTRGSVEEIRKTAKYKAYLRQYGPYLVGDKSDFDRGFATGKKKQFVLQWFRDNDDKVPLPAGPEASEQEGGTDTRVDTFKLIESAETIPIRGTDEAEEYKREFGAAISLPLHRVEVLADRRPTP